MKRHKHSLSHYKLLTCDMGSLVPVGCYEVLPGDSIQQATSALIRCSPLLAPVMHPVSARIHHWFVPNRICWEDWEDFITGGPNNDDPVSPPMYTLTQPIAEKSIADYMGVRPGVSQGSISWLPFRAYNLIYNEFYRDQDLVTAQPLDEITPPHPVAWGKDYFTAARPWPQKGPDITMPLGTSAPVIKDPNAPGTPTFNLPGYNGEIQLTALQSSQNAVWGAGNSPVTVAAQWNNPGLIADLAQATAVNVNDVRLAFALQRYSEARAQYGSRYTEYLAYLGVKSSDARLQRPEYLGGGKATISFSEVLQTGPDTDDAGIANMYGHGISAMRTRRFRRFFEEHGFVISLLSVRPRSIYQDGLHKMFKRMTKEDYWQKELEQIGQQEVNDYEVYWEGDNSSGVFGYQDRYAEYKHHPSTVAAEFRNTLDFWHMARKFASKPALNQQFISCVPTKRIFAEQTQNSLWVMINHSIQARRLVRRSAESRII